LYGGGVRLYRSADGGSTCPSPKLVFRNNTQLFGLDLEGLDGAARIAAIDAALSVLKSQRALLLEAERGEWAPEAPT
jgi:hypothetical protein